MTSRRTTRITSKSPAARHIARRSCLACRRIEDKRTLVRLVRTPAGRVEVDGSGKKAGRGGYLCPARACWEKALKGSQLEHALRGKIEPADREQLSRYGRELPGGDK